MLLVLFALLEHFGRFRLFHASDLVAGLDQSFGHDTVTDFGKAGVGNVSLHVGKLKNVHTHIGIHVVELIELA
jgi:hypothetical protein